MIPLGSIVARIGNHAAKERRAGRAVRILAVSPVLGEQLRADGRDRVHGLQVVVDTRLQEQRHVILARDLAHVDELLAVKLEGAEVAAE